MSLFKLEVEEKFLFDATPIGLLLLVFEVNVTGIGGHIFGLMRKDMNELVGVLSAFNLLKKESIV